MTEEEAARRFAEAVKDINALDDPGPKITPEGVMRVWEVLRRHGLGEIVIRDELGNCSFTPDPAFERLVEKAEDK